MTDSQESTADGFYSLLLHLAKKPLGMKTQSWDNPRYCVILSCCCGKPQPTPTYVLIFPWVLRIHDAKSWQRSFPKTHGSRNSLKLPRPKPLHEASLFPVLPLGSHRGRRWLRRGGGFGLQEWTSGRHTALPQRPGPQAQETQSCQGSRGNHGHHHGSSLDCRLLAVIYIQQFFIRSPGQLAIRIISINFDRTP